MIYASRLDEQVASHIVRARSQSYIHLCQSYSQLKVDASAEAKMRNVMCEDMYLQIKCAEGALCAEERTLVRGV